ncbi:MAG: sugar ABC transporter permease [Armatimonadota bacterium]|nr:sugar ABC transporter permease [Armatimonadota bacterium]MDR7402302.1 sugar ABC transporter permease [Armatimonadota bacterium]MDR7403821.1 sugar ABC transporter permease [Armatimonadota bacterium]MDR7437610.1 sugar ABC transporter permease [Armatimonadota bacterium]MDR7472626.1 sugar ABC transporter permease [Armatimonadota bacterium]
MRLSDRAVAWALIVPSLAAVGVFVYGFIGWTAWVSLTNWAGLRPQLAWVGVANYLSLFQTARFQIDLRNTVVFTILLVAACMTLGLGLAILLDRGVRGEGVFRTLYLFPLAISFIVTGVAWRWLLAPGDPATGRLTGINVLLARVGLPPLRWYTDPTILHIHPDSAVGRLLDQIGLGGLASPLWGIPVAMLSVVIAATWQMSGFVMALYLAALRSVPDELREAARIDGASEWAVYRFVLLPSIRPVTLSALIVLGHISLKIFDLVAAMSKRGPGFATDVPAYFMFEATFHGDQYALGASIAIVMLVAVSLLTVPYLVSGARREVQP